MGRLGLFAGQQHNISALSTRAAHAAGRRGRENSRDFIFSLLRVLMLVDQEDPTEQYNPRFKKLMPFFFFVKFCMYVTIFFSHDTQKTQGPRGNQVMLYHLQNTKESTAT